MDSDASYLYARAADPAFVSAGSCGGVVSALLRYMLETNRVDAVFTVRGGADLYDAVPVLLSDPREVVSAAGTCMSGTILLTKFLQEYLTHHPGIRVAIPLKCCDAMALYEMAKRGRVDLENIFMIGLTCSGTMSPEGMRSMIQDAFCMDPCSVDSIGVARGEYQVTSKDRTVSVRIDTLEKMGFARRNNCRRCEQMIPRQCDIACGRWGVVGADAGTVTFIETCSDRGRKLIFDAERDGSLVLEPAPASGIAARKKTEDVMIHLAQQEKRRQFKELGTGRTRLLYMIEETSRCIKCYQCIEACPLCICEECSTKKPWLVPPGLIPPPFLFHLIRFSHVADSCINCGQCEERCPMDIPLSLFMHALQSDLSDVTGFVPGINMEMPVFARTGDEEWEYQNPEANAGMVYFYSQPDSSPPF